MEHASHSPSTGRSIRILVVSFLLVLLLLEPLLTTCF